MSDIADIKADVDAHLCHIHIYLFIYLSIYNLYPEVGTRYFFRSPLTLVRYLEIVLPLRAGPQLKNFFFNTPIMYLKKGEGRKHATGSR